jgi:hypothetical protein
MELQAQPARSAAFRVRTQEGASRRSFIGAAANWHGPQDNPSLSAAFSGTANAQRVAQMRLALKPVGIPLSIAHATLGEINAGDLNEEGSKVIFRDSSSMAESPL